jgi:hypothetical protein
MGYHFNPPPGWPPAPPGWSPPPGWQPDPAWPPPPPGWQLWISDAETASLPSDATTLASPADTPGWHTGPGRGPDHGSSSPTRQPPLRRLWASFRGLPTWGKILVVVLLVALLPWLLIAAGLAAAGIGAASLIRGPLPRLGVTSRASATAALLLGLVAAGVGTAMAAALINPTPPQQTRPTATIPATTSEIPTSAPTTQAPPATTRPPITRPPTTKPPTTRPPGTVPPKAPATTHPPTATSPRPTPKPVQLCGAPPNPYGYNFCGRGGYVLDPAPDTCSYFDCIANFWNGTGHMEECQDHTYSMSGGRPGSCSYHGGNLQPVYRGP